MRRTSSPQQRLAAALTGLALAGSICAGLAAADKDLGTFDTGITGAPNWGRGWGTAAPEWDPTQDATGNGGGSCYISGNYTNDQNTLNVYGCISGNPWWHPDPSFDMTLYKSIEFDIKWNSDPTNMPLATFNANPGGDGGIAIWNSFDGNNWPTIGTATIPDAAATGWAHVSVPINPATANIAVSYGIMLKKWITAATKEAGGYYGFWVDNVVVKGTDAPPPPPSLSLEKPVPGLAFVASGGGQWDRQIIRTVGSNYTWIGASGPVTYEFDMAKHVDKAYAGFGFFMHLVPGMPDPGRGDSDWHETNVVMWTVGVLNDGAAWSELRYKTNAPDDNGVLFSTGALGGVWNATPVGTWKLTFENTRNVTITAPGGGTLITNLPQEVIDVFTAASPYMQINIGIVPGNMSRAGQMAVITGAKITGTAEPALNSNFLGQAPDTNYWKIIGNANGVQSIPTDAASWVKWTLPAVGFVMQKKATLDPGAWIDSTNSSYAAGGFQWSLLRQADLPSANSGYFRLFKQVATKLQILLPGESNAPGTPTGKTGTPIMPQNSLPYTFTVNAVDDNWNVVKTITDTIGITSSEAIALLPPNAALVNGTANFDITLFEAGTWTITATDVSDPAKAPATVSVTVP